MGRLAEEAVDTLERRVFFDQLPNRYESLHADPGTWREIEAERAAEGGALLDLCSSVGEIQTHDRQCRDTLTAPDKSDPLARRSLDVDASGRQAQNAG